MWLFGIVYTVRSHFVGVFLEACLLSLSQWPKHESFLLSGIYQAPCEILVLVLKTVPFAGLNHDIHTVLHLTAYHVLLLNGVVLVLLLPHHYTHWVYACVPL